MTATVNTILSRTAYTKINAAKVPIMVQPIGCAIRVAFTDSLPTVSTLDFILLKPDQDPFIWENLDTDVYAMATAPNGSVSVTEGT